MWAVPLTVPLSVYQLLLEAFNLCQHVDDWGLELGTAFVVCNLHVPLCRAVDWAVRGLPPIPEHAKASNLVYRALFAGICLSLLVRQPTWVVKRFVSVGNLVMDHLLHQSIPFLHVLWLRQDYNLCQIRDEKLEGLPESIFWLLDSKRWRLSTGRPDWPSSPLFPRSER